MKKWMLLLSVCLGLILLYCGCWFGYSYFKYQPYVEKIPQIENGEYLYVDDDHYNYSVGKPAFASFTGNLAISNADDTTSLIIWPLVFGGYEYGVQVQSTDNQYYEIMVDENMQFIPDENPDMHTKTAEQVLKLNKIEIATLDQKASDYWHLDDK